MNFCFKKFSKAIAALVIMLIAALATTAEAKEVTIGKLKYKVNTTDKIAKCTGLAEEATKNYNLTIPSTVTYEGVTLKVTTVEKEAFTGDNYLKKVTLSDNTETIGSYAFFGCDNISIVSLGKKLKIIGAYAFAHSGNSGTFTSITFPSTLEIIRDNTFMDCRYLETVVFGNKLQSIGECAFWHCDRLKTLLLPGSLQSIGESAFAICDNLTEVTFQSGNGNCVIGEKCFDNLKSLTILNFQGPGVAEIGPSAFIGCRIQWLYLPSSVKKIGGGAFCGNDLTIIELSEGLERIEELAFCDQYSTGVKKIAIPSTVTYIGQKAFWNCGDPADISCAAVNPPVAGELVFDINVYDSVKLKVPQASVGKYRVAALWKEFRYINDTDDNGVETVEMDADPQAGTEEWFNLQGNCVNPAVCPSGIYVVKTGGKIEKRVKQ
ncbi:MAG: leucine-rich repeat domain-containing protein [Muribaculaceae bacterium]|nr:leucine-rich repeat domain-containing protein [Muribaculaceae bacterium]